MPDIFSILEESENQNNTQSETQQENLDNLGPEENSQPEPEQGFNLSGDLSGNPEQQKINNMGKMAESSFGSVSVKNNEPLADDPTTWDPEYTMRGWMEETGTSLMRGVGKHIIKGSGDMIQMVNGIIPGMDIADGNMISRGLQEAGEEFAGKFKSYIPEELQHENLGWNALVNPKFWSTQAAEMIPQLAEFIFLSKGGSAIAKAGARKLAKSATKTGRKTLLGTAKATTLGQEVAYTGSGVAGQLITDVGLTQLGSTLTGAVGGGIAGNFFSGALNAAELVNSNKELKNPDGTPFYTNEQLGEMAAETMTNNAAWVGVDMLSWGMTYGGGWKALKNSRLSQSGVKTFNKVQQSKIASNLFSHSVNPIVKNLVKLGGKAGMEGIEETFQESFEEWAKMKAESEVTGKGDSTLLDFGGFMDFYNSKENKGTKVISFALGALGGGAGNVSSLINKKADDQYRLYNRNRNFAEIVKKQGTEEELTWQKYHIRQQLADIVISDKIDVYEEFVNGLVENGNIKEEEAQGLDEMITSFQDVKAKAKNLNVKGLSALMYNNAKENYFNSEIEYYKGLAESNIKLYESLEVNTPKEILEQKQKISDQKELFQTRLKALSIGAAKAKENQTNLILGKKANPIEVMSSIDQYGNVIVEAGLSNENLKDFTSEDEYYKDGKLKEKPGKPSKFKEEKEPKEKSFGLSDLGPKAKAYYEKIKASITGVNKDEDVLEDKESKISEEKNNVSENKIEDISQDDSIQYDDEGEIISTPITKEEAETEAEFALDEYTIASDESVSDEQYNNFKEGRPITMAVIKAIAEKVYDKGELSPREDEIKAAAEDLVKAEIVNLILPTETKIPKIDTPVAKSETDVSKNETSDDIEIEDETLTDEEKSFVDAEVNNKTKAKSSKDVIKSKNKKATKNWKPNLKDNDVNGLAGFDSREQKKSKSISESNKLIASFRKVFRFKTRLQGKSNVEAISENELDNYLNSMQSYNSKGPTEIEKMSVVNHQLKKMFPNTDTPVRTIIVDNMFEAIGSIGIGHALMSTIFIDEKAWNQNDVFMEELAHIYYGLSEDSEEVQAILKQALANKEFLNKIKDKYDDYTVYALEDGSTIRKDAILESLKSLSHNEIEEWFRGAISDGTIKTVPMKGQKYLLNELFANYIKGELASNFDKIFSPIQQQKREKSTRKFWGLIKKKGKLIESEDNVKSLLNALNKDYSNESKSLADYLKDSFRTITKGMEMNLAGLDSRADEVRQQRINGINEFSERANENINNAPIQLSSDLEQKIMEEELDDYDDKLETGVSFNKEFKDHIKSASRIMKRFGTTYNKALRLKFKKENKGKVVDRTKKAMNLFEKDFFESLIYNMASEIANPNEFGYEIEHSAIKEIQAFNSFLDKVHPERKTQILKSMHYVMSNSTHVVGLRNNYKEDGTHSLESSLSQKEISGVQNILDNMLEQRRFNQNAGTEQWQNFEISVKNILANKTKKADLDNVIKMVTDHTFKYNKVIEQGVVTYKGNTIPIETLIVGFIQKGMLHQNKNVNANVVYKNAKPLIDAFMDTNRKFTNTSSVFNAEGNMEPLRIVNNHLTKEIQQMTSFMSPNEKGIKPTIDEFLDRYSHTAHKNKDVLERRYVPNQFLVQIYNNFQKGILPTISQYHGIKNLDNDRSSLFKNSTANEQAIEDFFNFVNSSVNPNGTRNSSYLGNMGSFSDSPRKFLMNMKRIKYEEVFEGSKFHKDGKLLNSILNLHDQFYTDEINHSFDKNGKVTAELNDKTKKAKFKKAILNSIKNNIAFYENQSAELSKMKNLKGVYDANGKITVKGKKLIAEYTLNTTFNGYNVSDVFAPGIKGNNIVKRFKGNSSPAFSVKNPNFKIEPILVADTILNNSIAGSDSGMFITEYAAEQLRRLGKGVFNMNGGFKLLNFSIEKTNPKFKSKVAYFKGFTSGTGETIGEVVKEGHPYYKILKAREDKYAEYHAKKFNGEKPSMDLADGSFNHMAIIVPQSSDKANFFEDKMINEVKDENGDVTLEYTDLGSKMTPEYLKENIDDAMKYFDDMYYDSEGGFVGIESYNFGPQQLMDKETKMVNTPVQMENSVIVNAGINGKIDLANEIQQLISNQKTKNLNKALEKLKNNSPEEYKKFIEEGLNKEDMDQAQRILFEDGGSLAHPYLSEIVTNQLAKTLRREGNKLRTNGTYAQQKPDTGYKAEVVEGSDSMKGYVRNADSTMDAAEIMLPKHMEGKVKKRSYFTVDTAEGKTSIDANNSDYKVSKALGEDVIEGDPYTNDMNALQFGAIKYAMKRFGVSSKVADKRYVRELKNKANIKIGYYVKGEEIIASRVPGHGPASTGVFEVIGYDQGKGNQVMVSSEFNHIIGSDNDGDALFIQTKGKESEYADWNKAFDLMKDYWLSPEMQDQITAPIDFKKTTEAVVDEITKLFPKNKKYVMPFSPEQRIKDYNNTMVSKRNVGPVFNTHKITNLLAAYEVAIKKTIKINGVTYSGFKDVAVGNESRNQQSAILANIILDNAKDGYADAIGLDEHNITQAVLLVNLGVPLVEVAKILNSPSAKLWSEFNRNNASMFHNDKKKETIKNDIYSALKIKKNEKAVLEFNPNPIVDPVTKKPIESGAKFSQQQNAIIQTLDYLSNMNSEIQKISSIMSGHNKIHVNPLVLEKQLNDFNEVVYQNTEKSTLTLNDAFRTNPNMAHYKKVAETTLDKLQRLNPVYRDSTNKILKNLSEKIGLGNLSIKQIEAFSKDLMKFNTSRLLGLNNTNSDYVNELLNPKSNNSIFQQMKDYMNQDSLKVKDLKNINLFARALSMSLAGNTHYISTSTQFVNESFNEVERKQIQKEFEQLPPKLRNDLILYDMLKHGWYGPQSLAPFFSSSTNAAINFYSNKDLKSKSDNLSNNVAEILEKTIALKASVLPNNPFSKIYVSSSTKTPAQVKAYINKNKALKNKIKLGKAMYINVRKKNGNSLLFEIPEYTTREQKEILDYKGNKNDKIMELAMSKLKLVPNNKSYKQLEIDLALIPDKNGSPYKVFDGNKSSSDLDPMVSATIKFEEMLKNRSNSNLNGLDSREAREDYDSDLFNNKKGLSQEQFNTTMGYKSYVGNESKKRDYANYKKAKGKANELYKTVNEETIKNLSEEQLLDAYALYGEEDAYAYSVVMTPIIKELTQRQIQRAHKLWEKNKVSGKGYDGKDVTVMNAYLMTGSTIPSNHPAAQAMAKMMEAEYKKFINEKKKYMSATNKITDALYLEKLGYGGTTSLRSLKGIKNTLSRVRDLVFSTKQNTYDKLYGNLVIREEKLNDNGKLVLEYKLRPEAEINSDFEKSYISKAEKDFYDHFKKVTSELMPKDMTAEFKQDYIPHTSMTMFESLSSRGLLGLMTNARNDDEAVMDVKMKFKNEEGELISMPFSRITDIYKFQSAGKRKNDINKIIEYRKLKSKAKKLLKKGINEDGTPFQYSTVGVETVLGFGAINRFANNRSVKATELPSMDLNKALGDYIHSSLFVNGNDKFQGMKKLQGYIDGVLAFNRENNLPNMNIHVQKVWKDYFTKGKRQTSFAGKKVDRVVLGLTRMNLFYALGYQANVNTKGTYAIGNILSGKYHNIKDIGGKAWIKGEARYWGLDKGFDGGLQGIMDRHKRMNRIMKNINFMEINVYDEVNMEKKNGLDALFTDLALSPMILSERWIQRVHMIGSMTDEQLNKFDENGNYKNEYDTISEEDLIELEDRVKSSHGRGYQPTDQRAAQLYSWGSMMLQFSRFLPTMFQDRLAKEDVNIYGRENIGTLRAVGKMVRNVANNPKGFIDYRKSLSNEQRQRLDSGLKGMAMATALSLFNASSDNSYAESVFWDTNFYWNHPKLSGKLTPAAVRTTDNLVNSMF